MVVRDIYSAFPLKGKLPNIRIATYAQITKDKIMNLVETLGLK